MSVQVRNGKVEEVKKLSVEEEAEQKKATELKSDMDNQLQFFELRMRYALAMLTGGSSAVDPSFIFKRAHELAKLDYCARMDESAQLLPMHGITMRMPANYELLSKRNE